MFCGPDWMRRRSSPTSLPRPEWSYLASSGPKQRWHTYWAVSSYSAPHSRQVRLVTAMAGAPVGGVFFAGFHHVAKITRHTSGRAETAWHPGIGTFPR